MFSRKGPKDVEESSIEEVSEGLEIENELRSFEKIDVTPNCVECCVKDSGQIQLCIKIEEEVKKIYSCTIKVIEIQKNISEEFSSSSTDSEFDFSEELMNCSLSDKIEQQNNLENLHSMMSSKLSNLQTKIEDDCCLKDLLNEFLGRCNFTIDEQGDREKKEMNVIIVDAKELKERIIRHINDNYFNRDNNIL